MAADPALRAALRRLRGWLAFFSHAPRVHRSHTRTQLYTVRHTTAPASIRSTGAYPESIAARTDEIVASIPASVAYGQALAIRTVFGDPVGMFPQPGTKRQPGGRGQRGESGGGADRLHRLAPLFCGVCSEQQTRTPNIRRGRLNPKKKPAKNKKLLASGARTIYSSHGTDDDMEQAVTRHPPHDHLTAALRRVDLSAATWVSLPE
jgi:hypothetical protein